MGEGSGCWGRRDNQISALKPKVSLAWPPKPLGMLVGAGAAAVGAVGQLKDAFLKRAEELARYSPQIQHAQVYGKHQEMLADMREAAALGPDMARLDKANTDIWIGRCAT